MALTKEQRKTYRRKKKLLYSHMTIDKKIVIPIHIHVNRNLIKLVQNNNCSFVTSMYIDYIDHYLSMDYFGVVDVFINYQDGLHFIDEDDYYSKTQRFVGYLLTTVGEDVDSNGNHYYFIRRQEDAKYNELVKKYYMEHRDCEDNNILFSIISYARKLIENVSVSPRYASMWKLCTKMIAYFLKDNLVLENIDKYQKVLSYIINNYETVLAFIYINSDVRYINSTENEELYSIIRYLDPKDLIDEYYDEIFEKVKQ